VGEEDCELDGAVCRKPAMERELGSGGGEPARRRRWIVFDGIGRKRGSRKARFGDRDRDGCVNWEAWTFFFAFLSELLAVGWCRINVKQLV
jgi:hypothetical protein